MTTTAKPTHLWEPIFGGYVLRRGSDGYGIAEVMPTHHNGDHWSWKAFGSNKLSDAFPTAEEAKNDCEKVLNITVKPEVAKGQEEEAHERIRRGADEIIRAREGKPEPGDKPRCNKCGWLLMERIEDGCTAGSCSQRPVLKKQEDQPSVIVPPNDFADALDSHAAKVAEDDAEDKSQRSIREAKKRIWGDRLNEADDAEAKHAEAMAQPERHRGHASQPAADRKFTTYTVHDTLRLKHYPTTGGWRVWKIIGVHLGATYQESTYAMVPLDIDEHEPIHVPCIILESHPFIEKG